jgi:hypothetical protein
MNSPQEIAQLVRTTPHKEVTSCQLLLLLLLFWLKAGGV